MVRALIAYIFCIVVCWTVVLRAFQPVAASDAAPVSERPVYPRALKSVSVSVEDAPDATVICVVPIDRLSMGAIHVLSMADRESVLDGLGCER